MKIAIIGAGLSGLSCAYRLEQLGFKGQLDIYEKKPAVGEANVFLEFVSELFYRPFGDFFAHLAQDYKLYLLPQQTIYLDQEYRWSLALRQAWEKLNPQQYDLIVEGIDTLLGRAVLKQGGINLLRLGGRLLSLMTKKSEAFVPPNNLKKYSGDTLYKRD